MEDTILGLIACAIIGGVFYFLYELLGGWALLLLL
jgi:hypothetical protein